MAYGPYLSGGANEGRPQTRDKCKMDLLASLCALPAGKVPRPYACNTFHERCNL
jgi:hypothetical protein